MRRSRAGTLMRFSESNSTRPWSTIRPRSGDSSPAIARNVIVLPEPEGPSKPSGAAVRRELHGEAKAGHFFSIATSRDMIPFESSEG